jgi:hypothetical protein
MVTHVPLFLFDPFQKAFRSRMGFKITTPLQAAEFPVSARLSANAVHSYLSGAYERGKLDLWGSLVFLKYRYIPFFA